MVGAPRIFDMFWSSLTAVARQSNVTLAKIHFVQAKSSQSLNSCAPSPPHNWRSCGSGAPWAERRRPSLIAGA